MPKYVRRPVRWYTWLLGIPALAGFAYVLASFIVKLPLVALPLLVAGVVLALVENKRHQRRMTMLQAARRGESICQFARSFDCRSVDPWVIRAVYEQLQSYLRHGGEEVPLRSTDLLKHDLRIDDEDLDMGLAEEIAQRTRRSLERAEKNPYFGKVRTAGDLVLFFNEQPKSPI